MKGHEKIFEEIIVKNFPKMGKEMTTHIQEAQNSPYRVNPSRKTPRHILIKLTKFNHKHQILTAVREKQQITYKEIPIRITADLSTETLQARREWQDEKVMKGEKKKKSTTKITLPSKDLIQFQRRNQKLYRQAKAERIQHHKTSSSTNAKGSSLDRKHRKGL